MLLHGHLDSWHVGIGDNATGDATLLELARVFGSTATSWSARCASPGGAGHSHGRYAGSTWYADAFALDLVAQLRRAHQLRLARLPLGDVYKNVSWMSEAEAVRQARRSATSPVRARRSEQPSARRRLLLQQPRA